MGILDRLFGKKPDFSAMLENGATIVDVRSKQEFQQGHAKGSVNIPLDQINGKMAKINKMKQPILMCCASGMRSGRATSILKRNGVEAYNVGGWRSVGKYQ